MLKKVRSLLFDQKTILLFVILCILGIAVSGQTLRFILDEVLTRLGRNAFLVLALLIPISTGMGLNFSLVIGAIAAQIGVFFVVHWGFTGFGGLLLCVALATPLAMLFGWMTGRLFNRMKGSEMIGGLILGYFADGLYQLFFLFIIGGVIPVKNPVLIISNGIGVKNTIDLAGNLKYALDDLVRISALDLVTLIAVISAFRLLYRLARCRREFGPRGNTNIRRFCLGLLLIAACYALTYIPFMEALLRSANVPLVTYFVIALLFVFNGRFMRTVMGQNMRAIGRNIGVATASGINVDRTRSIAMILSTVFASWGQLIYLQNMGTFQTYGAHYQVGQYAIAALLVGGASVHQASGKQAIIGVILFHTLFIVSPLAGKNLFGNAGIGEYFRVFVSYGVIAVSLAFHAWKHSRRKSVPPG